jgi:hypothetical protein
MAAQTASKDAQQSQQAHEARKPSHPASQFSMPARANNAIKSIKPSTHPSRKASNPDSHQATESSIGLASMPSYKPARKPSQPTSYQAKIDSKPSQPTRPESQGSRENE